MKPFNYLLSIMLLGIANVSLAQPFTLFNTSENIDVANIKAAHLVHGDMWWDPASGTARCEFPKGSGKHVGFATSLWMGGFDPMASLKVAAHEARTGGKTDYWPGPVDTTATTAAQLYASSQMWAKIWKISSRQIDTFLAAATHTAANTPVPILEWPAKGNPYAKGAGGVSLTITQDMAPFVDINSDGQYDPLAGDYPRVKGNQMLWWIINDYGPTHNVAATLPLKMEIRMSAYAYARGTIADNIIFYEYELTNKSSTSLNTFRMGISTDADLGYAFDDYIGFDSTHRMGIVYNGKSVDGTGEPSSYGLNPPMMGIAIVELPGDAGSSFVPAGSFGYYNNSGAMNAIQYNNTLRATYPNSTYGFNEDSECHAGNMAGDRRFVIASNDLTFSPGQTKKIATALVVCANAGGCPRMNFNCIHNVADSAWYLYRNPPSTANPLGVATAHKASLRIYPNPTSGLIYIETAGGAPGSLSIYDALGRSVLLPVTQQGTKINVNTSGLPGGVYSIRYQTSKHIQTGIFVKE